MRWLSSEYACRALGVSADAARVEIRGTDLYGLDATSQPAEPRSYAWGLHSGGRTDAVRFEHNLVDDVTASAHVGTGIMVQGDPGGLTVTENAFTTALSATWNWWGHRNGPRSVASDRSADDDRRWEEQGAYVGPVTVDPWLTGTIRSKDDRTNWYVDTRLSSDPLDSSSDGGRF